MAQTTASEAWAEHAVRRLADAGYRRGGARRAVVELLARQGCALTALDIERQLEDSDRGVARATVYRVLEELEQLGVVGRVEVGDKLSRYEPLHPDGHQHHHHLVCDGCGELVPFHDDELERAIAKVARKVAFEVSGHDVTLRGTCSACSAKR
ncbi:MAG TPA: Fur family transcriptional regulator [Solirubrobacteraceae bacterium]|nr:Fur family transcriptional regulator [Solirubrobacteraceae bacterium]